MLSHEVEKIVECAIAEARSRRHEFATVEHLCLALFEHQRIKNLLLRVGVSEKELKSRFLDYIEHQIEILPSDSKVETLPSLGFQRVLQRAAVHIVGAGKEEVAVEHVLVATFDEDESYAVFMMQQAGITRLDLVSVISHGGFGDSDAMEPESFIDAEQDDKKLDSALARFTLCLTEQARQGCLDQVIGRTQELERAVQVLSRRRKNNPLFVGEPGVGKTALAEGLAQKIISKKVPKNIANSELYLLDMGSLLAGARYRGDFENRMKAVLKTLENQQDAILVIDEIHTVVGAGATSGSSMDASNLLKPILSQGKLRCIGSTTYKEYRQYFEKDRALARRFQKIDIEEPNNSECLKILEGIRERYQDFHGVSISDEALSSALKLSQRFLHERKLPDKAIDLIDEACAKAKLAKNTKVDESAIEQAIASMAHIPAQKISRNDKQVLQNLERDLKAQVFGQNHAIEKLCSAIMLARSGLRDQEKPIGSFLFSGPSGVGKTEVAKQLADILGVSFARFDMSEYMERHAASRLVGAPPGYVGYEQGGLLTDAVYKNPYCVLLLDEIEKAHPDVFNMLLQVMDYGKLTDSNGRPADFRHVILIMTSNLGARDIEKSNIGFLEQDISKSQNSAIIKFFSPEFRNRIDTQVVFNHLDKNILDKIVDKFITNFKSQLEEKKISLEITAEAKIWLAQQGYDKKLGARPLARVIQEFVKKPIAKELVFGQLKAGAKIKLEIKNKKINFVFS